MVSSKCINCKHKVKVEDKFICTIHGKLINLNEIIICYKYEKMNN